VGAVLGVLVLAVVFVFGWLTLAEYKPDDVETVEVEGTPAELLYPGSTVRLVSWNIGYGALGDNADFFMDGGSGVRTADEARVRENVQAVIDELAELAPDAVLLQECDRDSDRSYGIDEAAWIADELSLGQSTFAYNYRCLFVPFPVPPIGGVNSGLLTLSAYPVASSARVSLPCPFSWPVRVANLKRCLLVDRIPLYGSDKELVLINLHLEAYDSGEGKIAQTAMLRGILQAEAEKGNYVIAGGDFNQIFSSIVNPFPSQEGMWLPGEIDVSAFGGGWQYLMDTTRPSCRSLDKPLAGADTEGFQYYLIDGFIVSEGIEILGLQTQDLGFVNSDHDPVVLDVRLPWAY
jgi:endonuclease/exonuclease/phosphatase family metal-dependent hydrolase